MYGRDCMGPATNCLHLLLYGDDDRLLLNPIRLHFFASGGREALTPSSRHSNMSWWLHQIATLLSFHTMICVHVSSVLKQEILLVLVCFVGNMQCTVGSRLWCKFVCFHSKHDFYDTWRYSEAAPHYQSQQDGAPGGPLKFDSLDSRGSFCFEVWCTFFNLM